jgi:hypothetical protein
MFAVFGLVAGVIFSGAIGLLEAGHRLDQMSASRFSAVGGSVGVLLAITFVLAVALSGDRAFLWYLLVLGPLFGLACAACAAGSLVLARRGPRWRRLLVESGAGVPGDA